jgi:hypothetical protein
LLKLRFFSVMTSTLILRKILIPVFIVTFMIWRRTWFWWLIMQRRLMLRTLPFIRMQLRFWFFLLSKTYYIFRLPFTVLQILNQTNRGSRKNTKL